MVSQLVEGEAGFLVRTTEQPVLSVEDPGEHILIGVTPGSEGMLPAADLRKRQVGGLWGKELKACVKLQGSVCGKEGAGLGSKLKEGHSG